MITIKDVAREAGVSTATVSRILNADKTYKTTAETRERVWSVVSELGYIPNQTARRLSSQGQSKERLTGYDVKLGCILSVPNEKYEDPYFMAILSGIESKLIDNGSSMSAIRNYSELLDRSVLLNMLSESLSGIIIMESLPGDIYDNIKDRIKCIVGIDTTHNDIDNICYDRYEAADKAVKHLIEKGHRRIGYLGGSDISGDIRKEKRYRGYLSALMDAGIEEDTSIVRNTGWNREKCYESTMEILNGPNPPTAFLAASDIMGIVALSAIYEKGLKVPDEIAVIGISNIEMAQYSNPSLSTVAVPMRQMGEVAAEVLLSRIKGDSSLPKKIILPTELIVRAST